MPAQKSYMKIEKRITIWTKGNLVVFDEEVERFLLKESVNLLKLWITCAHQLCSEWIIFGNILCLEREKYCPSYHPVMGSNIIKRHLSRKHQEDNIVKKKEIFAGRSNSLKQKKFISLQKFSPFPGARKFTNDTHNLETHN